MMKTELVILERNLNITETLVAVAFHEPRGKMSQKSTVHL